MMALGAASSVFGTSGDAPDARRVALGTPAPPDVASCPVSNGAQDRAWR